LPVPSLQPRIAILREKLYAFMTRNAVSAWQYFQIPPKGWSNSDTGRALKQIIGPEKPSPGIKTDDSPRPTGFKLKGFWDILALESCCRLQKRRVRIHLQPVESLRTIDFLRREEDVLMTEGFLRLGAGGLCDRTTSH
jgi:hypothetical protein